MERKQQDLKMESDIARGGRMVLIATLFWIDKDFREETSTHVA